MASVYGSSPVAQPADQMESGRSRGAAAMQSCADGGELLGVAEEVGLPHHRGLDQGGDGAVVADPELHQERLGCEPKLARGPEEGVAQGAPDARRQREAAGVLQHPLHLGERRGGRDARAHAPCPESSTWRGVTSRTGRTSSPSRHSPVMSRESRETGGGVGRRGAVEDARVLHQLHHPLHHQPHRRRAGQDHDLRVEAGLAGAAEQPAEVHRQHRRPPAHERAAHVGGRAGHRGRGDHPDDLQHLPGGEERQPPGDLDDQVDAVEGLAPGGEQAPLDVLELVLEPAELRHELGASAAPALRRVGHGASHTAAG